MGLIIDNNDWLLQENIIEPTYKKTLKTKGYYLDKNVNIILTPKVGEVELDATSKIEQTIQEKDDDHFEVTATTVTTITPSVTGGWVTEVSQQQVTSMGSLIIDRTKLLSGLVSDSSKESGSSYYRVTATQGYNDVNLDKNINVYQGKMSFSEE